MHSIAQYPPPLSEDHLLSLSIQIQDWLLNHGSLIKDINTQTALELQSIYNELYCAVAEDEQWILSAIEDLLPIDPLAVALWKIHQEVKQLGGYVQPISAGIFRSDYMLQDENTDTNGEPSSIPHGSLKQVEFNTFSCAGASHANKIVDMHRHLARAGVYNANSTPSEDDTDSSQLIVPSNLPRNRNIETLAAGLASAHAAYGPPKSKVTSKTAVLIVIQDQVFNFNVADERPIEYALWDQDPPVPTYRLNFGDDTLEDTSLTATGELLFHPPWLNSTTPIEISVVYMRAGYEAHEYDKVGIRARLRLERSRAIKCPSLLAHIATFKKVQYALTRPGTLEHFLTPEKAAAVRATFVPMYPMDESPAGQEARKLATDPVLAEDYVLKPSLEGGGHNVYGDAIPDFLASQPPSKWGAYILMKRIPSPFAANMLMSSVGMNSGGVISELGVFGSCLWRTGGDGRPCEMLENSLAGWSFKTKHQYTEEISVVKGYGCFDTPLLV
ncbi:putative glutathione synthetase [Aspergillus candidus]|uniref:Glutathione synthetase n=1 Tax=Aspergillus candidus TaxID=41067 RepID=A0A2I2FDY9_ASPCN|nr:putative glutathione synthetase [Aspergillus candidus]PLB38851.1 putative glutathione synthetase [Aspergillus candidus]